jgi:hypothetical protein
MVYGFVQDAGGDRGGIKTQLAEVWKNWLCHNKILWCIIGRKPFFLTSHMTQKEWMLGP